MTQPAITPRCDALAREHMRPSAEDAKVIDWIALAQTLERELRESSRVLAEEQKRHADAISYTLDVLHDTFPDMDEGAPIEAVARKVAIMADRLRWEREEAKRELAIARAEFKEFMAGDAARAAYAEQLKQAALKAVAEMRFAANLLADNRVTGSGSLQLAAAALQDAALGKPDDGVVKVSREESAAIAARNPGSGRPLSTFTMEEQRTLTRNAKPGADAGLPLGVGNPSDEAGKALYLRDSKGWRNRVEWDELPRDVKTFWRDAAAHIAGESSLGTKA